MRSRRRYFRPLAVLFSRPVGRPDQEVSAEFEAEVKMTLQAIGDQLQYLTERMYRQERESCDIRQVLADWHERDAAAAGAEKKKSNQTTATRAKPDHSIRLPPRHNPGGQPDADCDIIADSRSGLALISARCGNPLS
jgi:hypothetical protein